MSTTGPLTKPKRRLSKATSPSSPIRNSFNHTTHPLPHTISQSSSSSSITTLPSHSHSHSRAKSSSFSYPLLDRRNSMNNSHHHNTHAHAHAHGHGQSAADGSFGATSATVTGSPVGGMTFSISASGAAGHGHAHGHHLEVGDEREGAGVGLGKPIHMNGNGPGPGGLAGGPGSTGTNGLLSSRHHLHSSSTYHHHHQHHPPSTNGSSSNAYGISSSSSTPTFPGLTEDYEPSSSGRSSNDTPVLLHTGTFPPSIVGSSGEASSGAARYMVDESAATPKGLGYGYAAGGGGGGGGQGQGMGLHGRTILLGDGSVPGDVGSVASKERETRPFKIFGIDIKWISLMTLALQNAFLTVIMHYSRIKTAPSRAYSAASAVLLNELLKGSISLLIALKRLDIVMTKEESHLRSPVVKSRAGTPIMPSQTHHYSAASNTLGGAHPSREGQTESMGKYVGAYLKRDRWRRLGKEIFSPDCWKLSIPAILYVIQNNLQYTAASNLDVATFQVTYQMKILTTAFFSVLMLGKRLSTSKWLALLLLAAGVGIVQIQSGAAAGPTQTVAPGVVESQGSGNDAVDAIVAVAARVQHEMSPLRGFGAVCAACVTSGLAGVYFEMVLKGSKADLWTRNAQLSLFSLVPALLPILFGSATGPRSGSGLSGILLEPFKNFSGWAWGTVLTQVFGGLVTAVVIKYSDNILKGFATSLSIILSFVASVFLFNYHVTPAFVMGSSIVLSATFMYNQPANNKPNPLVAGLANKIAEATGGKVDPSTGKSRTAVAVPGSPIPANAPIIGETPRPSRTSSMVSLFGLGQSLSRAPTPQYPNGLSVASTPYLTAHPTPNVSAHPSAHNLLALGGGKPPLPFPISRNSSTYSVRSTSGSEAGNGFTSLQSFTPSTSPTSARGRKISGRHGKERPVLEVKTDVECKTR